MKRRHNYSPRSFIALGLVLFSLFEGAHAKPHPHQCIQGQANQQQVLRLLCESGKCTKNA